MNSSEQLWRKERLAGILLLALTVINIAEVFYLVPKLQRGYQDFTAFYCGALMIRAGEGARLYDLQLQYQTQLAFAPHVEIRNMALPYNHPPFEAVLLLPLAYLNFLPAYLAWTVLNIVMLALVVAVVRRTFPVTAALDGRFLLLAVAAFAPVGRVLIQGQDSVLLTLLATVGVALLEKEQDAAAGAALALCLFKFQIALPLTFILAVRKPRLLLGFIPTAAGLAAMSAAVVGWRGVAGYVHYVLKLEKSGAGGAIPAAGMPNLHGLIASLAGAGARSATTMWVTAGASVAAIAVAAWLVRRRDASMQFVLAVASVTALLVSYHALMHDLTLLLPVMLLLFASPTFGRWEIRGDVFLLAASYIVLSASTHWWWLNPLWCPPVVVWIFWKFGRGRCATLLPARLPEHGLSGSK